MTKNVPHLIRTRISDDQRAAIEQLKQRLNVSSDTAFVRLALQRLAESEGVDWPELPPDFVSKRGGAHGGGRPRKG